MKVTLPKNYRRVFTLDDLDRAKMVIKYEKEDDFKIDEWVEMATREAISYLGVADYFMEVLKAEANACKNYRAMDLYDEDSNSMDVWIEFTSKTGFGFIEGGAYLSDIWQTGAVPYGHEMSIEYYIRHNGN